MTTSRDGTDRGERPALPETAFARADEGSDELFYAVPRLVTHIDGRAVAAVTALYRELFPSGGTLLDLMSSWVSHLPPEIAYAAVVGHGMNRTELAANPRLTRVFTQDLNRDPVLPLPDTIFDGAAICVSIQYLRRPVDVLAEVRRVLRPEAPIAVTFSNRCFPTKAVAIWTCLRPDEQAELVSLFLRQAGFDPVNSRELLKPPGDPLRAVIGWAP